MPTTGTSCRSCRRGTSTILGTIIFIGIMFTAVIPMLLVMRQADMLLEQRKYELGCLDEERSNEDLYIYVFPSGGATSPDLKVTAQNKGELSLRVVRLWINDDIYELDSAMQPMSGTQDLGTFTISPQNDDSFYFMATTDRGNVVAFDTPLTWKDQMGWETDIFSVNVLITSLPGQEFKIEIWNDDPLVLVGDSLTEKFDPKFFVVDFVGTYTVKILRGTKTIYTEDVTITWPDGPPVEWVFA